MLIVFIWGLFVARDAILDIKHYSFHIRALEQNKNKKQKMGVHQMKNTSDYS